MLDYLPELEKCFSVVKKGSDGREFQVDIPPVVVPPASGSFAPHGDHLDPAVSQAAPGTKQRIEDLKRYYEQAEHNGQHSPFTNDIANDLAELAVEYARSSKRARYSDVLIHETRQIRSEVEE